MIAGSRGSTDLRGVEVIDAELPFIEQAGANVRAQAQAMQRHGTCGAEPPQNERERREFEGQA